MRSEIKFLLAVLSLSGGFSEIASGDAPGPGVRGSTAATSCLTQVADFAIRICGEIANSGTKTVVDASGNVQAGVSDIIRNVVGGVSTNINGHVLYDTYTGVLRKQLGDVQFNVIDCRQKMVNVAVAQVCHPEPSAQQTDKCTQSKTVSNGEPITGGCRFGTPRIKTDGNYVPVLYAFPERTPGHFCNIAGFDHAAGSAKGVDQPSALRIEDANGTPLPPYQYIIQNGGGRGGEWAFSYIICAD